MAIFFLICELNQLIFLIVAEFNDIHIIEKLFDAPVVAIVSLSFPKKLRVRQFEKGEEIWSYTYSNIILSVKMNNMVSRINVLET